MLDLPTTKEVAMKNRLGLIAAAVTIGLLITGISWAASGNESDVNLDVTAGQLIGTEATVEVSGSESTVTSMTGTNANGESTVNLNLAAGQETEVAVEDAGTIRLANSGNSLTILSAQAAAGFVVEVEVPEGREVEADFRGEGRRLQFNAELEDGVVRVRIRTEGNAGNDLSTDTTATTTNGTSTTSTTIDDNGDDAITGNVPSGPVTYQVAAAGSVTVLFVNGQMQLGLVAPSAGWLIDETRSRTDEVEVRFTNGDLEARLKVRIENGQVRVEIENKD
jgi:hypothetical protein